ncbi:hypothetical protein BH09MYX1_BH09MYX1_50630 [soil metagenome]
MSAAFVFPVVMLVAAGGYTAYMMSKRNQAMNAVGPAMHDFFQRTGFRYPDMPPEPIAAHVQRATFEAQSPAGSRAIHYVRNFHGITIHHHQAFMQTDAGYSVSCSWSAELPRPPAIPFQVADKSLSSVGKAVLEAFSNSTRQWSPRHAHDVMTGVPNLDQRFRILGRDPNAVRALFQRDPALAAALLQQVEVDLWVDDQRAVFSDPSQKNMNAGMGGTVGQMAMGFDIAKRMDLSVGVHERISELLALAVRAAIQ